MNTSQNKYDPVEKIIFDEGLQIVNLEVHKRIDRILIFLSTGLILSLPLSKYKSLKKASAKDLKKFELIACGTGIHWPAPDEDLSLKGFLKDTLQELVSDRQCIIA